MHRVKYGGSDRETKIGVGSPFLRLRVASIPNLSLLGEHAQKKMSQIVEKVHKGGGVKSKIKKVYISNVDYFET